jgi:hypothetical protein
LDHGLDLSHSGGGRPMERKGAATDVPAQYLHYRPVASVPHQLAKRALLLTIQLQREHGCCCCCCGKRQCSIFMRDGSTPQRSPRFSINMNERSSASRTFP